RHQRAVARWLAANRECFNLVYVSSLGHDASAALGAVRKEAPVVLRAERAGPAGDCAWQLASRTGRRIKRRAMKADALVGPCRSIHEELIAAGYPTPRVHLIPHGTPPRQARTPERRLAARKCLGECHTELQIDPVTPLAVYTGSLERRKELELLVPAWKPILARWPGARLWLAGMGPMRRPLIDRIRQAGLQGRIVPLGTFDAVDTLLDAADLFVSPSPEADVSLSLLEAMAAGLPIVAADSLGNREALTDGINGLLFRPGDPAALATSIHRLIDDPDLAARLATSAHRRVETDFPLAKTVDAHLSLFETLLETNAL
ncbi:MAG: glycosyltransferase family 4 protein, partial [Pirellulales bacterium]|nr:glycosyltransferase family 4 protein [Pirellulales bacterium]